MKSYPEETTREGWQQFFSEWFPDQEGVLVTVLTAPSDANQMVAWGVNVERLDDDMPLIGLSDVYDDTPFRFHVESVEVEIAEHVLRVSAPSNEGHVVLLSNRLMEEQRSFIAGRKEEWL